MADVAVIRDFFVALGFKTNESDAKKMQGSLVDTEAKAKLLNKALVGLAAAALVGVAKTAQELDKLYYSSQRIGASASNVQAFGDAISQLGGNAESAVASLENVSQKIRNSPGYENMVQGLGVATRDQNGAVRDRVEVLKDLSGTLAKMPQYQANAYASSLGIDEQTMMSMRDGKFVAGIEKYQKMRKEMGMTDELAKSGSDFMVESRELGMAVKGVSEVLLMTAGKALIPFLKLLNKSIQTAIHLFSELHPAIKGTLAVGLKFAFLALVFSAFFKSLMMLRTGLTLLMSFLPVLKALRLAFLMSPIGIIVALAAAIAMLWDDYKTWKEGGKSLFDWGGWTDGIDKIINKIKDFIEMINKIKDKVINFIKKVVDDPVGAAQDVAVAAQEALANVVSSESVQKAAEVGGAIVEAGKGIVSGVISKVDDFIGVEQLKPNVKQATPTNAADLAAFAQNQSVPSKVSPAVNVVNQGISIITNTAKVISDTAKELVAGSISDMNAELGVVSAKYEGKIGSANKDIDQDGNPAGWAYGKYQFNSAKGGLTRFMSDNPDIKKHFNGLTPGSNEFNEKWKKLAKLDPVGFERAQNKSAANLWYAPAEKAYGKAGFDLNNRGVQEAVFSSSIQHGGVVRKLLPLAQKLAGKNISDLTAQEQIKLIYKARTKYHANGKKRYDNEVNDALSLSSNWISRGATAQQGSDLPNIQSYAPPAGNPHKGQINSSNMSASNVTIHQSFKTDMTINGARDPVESANAVKRHNENSLAFMARNATSPLVG